MKSKLLFSCDYEDAQVIDAGTFSVQLLHLICIYALGVEMQESEKRKERLKAMRMEAAQARVNSGSETSGLPSMGLSNPLVESETVSITPLQYNSPRFDYYTDPMAAFSGSKRRNNISPQVSQGNYYVPPRNVYHGVSPGPVHQNPVPNFSGQRTFHGPGTQFNQVPPRSPVEAFRPFGGLQGNPPAAWGGSGGTFNYNSPPILYQGDRFTSPSFGQGESPVCYGRGRGQRYTSSSHYDSGRGGTQFHDSGRGRGQWLGSSMSPGSSSSSRRGAGSHGSVSAELRPDLYYSKEMVDDPWRSLTPVSWKGVETLDSVKSWLPKSISSTKKAKVSPESSKISIPQPSLAEYLAASFNDSVNEAVDDEQGI